MPPADEGIVDEEQIIMNGYIKENSIDNNVVEEKKIQTVTPDPEPDLPIEENSKSIDDNSIKTRFGDEESVRHQIENEKKSIEKEQNKKPIEKKLAQDNPKQNIPSPYNSQQDNLKQNDPERDMQVDQKSMDQKKIDKKSMRSDNYIVEKPIDKDSSIESKNQN